MVCRKHTNGKMLNATSWEHWWFNLSTLLLSAELFYNFSHSSLEHIVVLFEAIFVYCCLDCQSWPASVKSIVWATWAIWPIVHNNAAWSKKQDVWHNKKVLWLCAAVIDIFVLNGDIYVCLFKQQSILVSKESKVEFIILSLAAVDASHPGLMRQFGLYVIITPTFCTYVRCCMPSEG